MLDFSKEKIYYSYCCKDEDVRFYFDQYAECFRDILASEKKEEIVDVNLVHKINRPSDDNLTAHVAYSLVKSMVNRFAKENVSNTSARLFIEDLNEFRNERVAKI